jgi:glycerol-3-phosphate O-acyltransferase
LRELATKAGDAKHLPRLAQIYEVLRYMTSSILRLIFRRWKRYGRAAVVIGEPWRVDSWLRELEERGTSLFAVSRSERLGHVQAFADSVMEKIGELVPVTSVSLACAALETFPSEYVDRTKLLERMSELRAVLIERGAHVIRRDIDIAEVFDRAYRMLRMRRIIARQGAGFLVLPRGRPLIAYYANSVRHLCEPALSRLREGEDHPVDRAMASLPAAVRP